MGEDRVSEIAGRLTEAQRSLVLAIGDKVQDRGMADSTDGDRLFDLGLMSHAYTGGLRFVSLTDIGLAVHQVLSEDPRP